MNFEVRTEKEKKKARKIGDPLWMKINMKNERQPVAALNPRISHAYTAGRELAQEETQKNTLNEANGKARAV